MLSRKRRRKVVEPKYLTVCQFIVNDTYYYNKYTYSKDSNVLLFEDKTEDKYNIYNFMVLPSSRHWKLHTLISDHPESSITVSMYEDEPGLTDEDTFIEFMNFKRFNSYNFYKDDSSIFRVPAEQMVGIFHKVRGDVRFKDHFIYRVQQRAGDHLIDIFETMEYIIDVFLDTGIEGLDTRGKAFHFDNNDQIFVLAYNPLFKTLVFITFYHQNQQNNDDFRKYKKGVRFCAKRGFDTSNRNKVN